MEIYKHKVQYYETDKMGITHHSNYIRWMEEARIDFLSRIGWDYKSMEDSGIISDALYGLLVLALYILCNLFDEAELAKGRNLGTFCRVHIGVMLC